MFAKICLDGGFLAAAKAGKRGKIIGQNKTFPLPQGKRLFGRVKMASINHDLRTKPVGIFVPKDRVW